MLTKSPLSRLFSLLLPCIVLAVLTGMTPHICTATPILESDTKLSSAGYFRLSWKNSSDKDTENTQYELQEASDPAFTHATILYSGPDTASLISGRRNGIYYYRVGSVDEQAEPVWSNSQIVEVSHHPLSRAFMFFALGALVFIATLTMVIVGNKAHKR